MKYYRKPDIPTNLQKKYKAPNIFLWRGKKAKAPAAIIVHYTAVLNKYSKTDYNSIIVYFAYVCKFDKKCLSVCISLTSPCMSIGSRRSEEEETIKHAHSIALSITSY